MQDHQLDKTLVATTSTTSSDITAMRLEEYKTLRAEVLERIKETNTLIITAAGGIGGAYAVIVSTFARPPVLSFSHASGFVLLSFLVMVWTPVAFAALAYIKSREIWNVVIQISDHLQKIEEQVYGNAPVPLGWEKKMGQQRQVLKQFWERLSGPPYTYIYCPMIYTCSAIALLSTLYVVWGAIR
jgi:hypothetical protein